MNEQNETLLSKEENMSISDITSDSSNFSAGAEAVDGAAITMSYGMNSTSTTTATTEPEEGEAVTPTPPGDSSSTTTTTAPEEGEAVTPSTPSDSSSTTTTIEPEEGEAGTPTAPPDSFSTTTTETPNEGNDDPVVNGTEVKVMTGDGTSLSVYASPSESSPCIGSFADGSIVTLTSGVSPNNGWYAVQGTTVDGVSTNGWCRGNYLAKSIRYGILVDVPLLNVRSDTSTTAEILGILQQWQSVQVLHENYVYTNNYLWHKILYEGSVGYVVAGNETPNFEFETRWVCLYDGDSSTDGEYTTPEGGTEDSSSTTTTEFPEGEAVTPTPPFDSSSTTTTSYPDNVEDEVEEPRSEDAYHVIVTDSMTGLPIPNATVYSFPVKTDQTKNAQFLSTHTDSNGYATLPSTGPYEDIENYSLIGIVVHADGYADWVSETSDLQPSSNEISAKMISRDQYPKYELPLNVSGPSRDSHTDFGWRYLSEIDYHTGIDIGNIGTADKTVRSICDGVIVKNRFDVNCGNYITVENEDGFYVTYMHLDLPEGNKVGDVIKTGDKIGIMSNTNLSSNPSEYQDMPVHLHIMISKTNTVSPDSRDHIDPKAFLTF